MYLKGGCCTATESQLQAAAYASQSPSFQVRVSGVVQIHEESEQGKAKSKAGMKRKGADGKGLIWYACIKNTNN